MRCEWHYVILNLVLNSDLDFFFFNGYIELYSYALQIVHLKWKIHGFSWNHEVV